MRTYNHNGLKMVSASIFSFLYSMFSKVRLLSGKIESWNGFPFYIFLNIVSPHTYAATNKFQKIFLSFKNITEMKFNSLKFLPKICSQ